MLYTIELYRTGRVILAVSDQLPNDEAALALARSTLDQHPAERATVYRQDLDPRNIVGQITSTT